MMNLQAYIDDSYKDAVYVLAGHISTAEKWAAFSKRWEQLLDFAPIDKYGKRNFHLTEVRQSQRAIDHLPAFWRTIQEHTICSLYFSYNMDDFRRAKERLAVVPYRSIDWGKFESDFTFAFSYLMDAFVRNRGLMAGIGEDEPISFFFDKHSDEKHILQGWYDYVDNREDLRKHFRTAPRFEDDTEFLPLQAADFFAGFIRCIDTNDLDWMSPNGYVELPKLETLAIRVNEDQMTEYLMGAVAAQLPEGFLVMDTKP